VILTNWWRRRRAQRSCFHHDWRTGRSWIADELIDMGMRKMFTCWHCDKVWFV